MAAAAAALPAPNLAIQNSISVILEDLNLQDSSGLLKGMHSIVQWNLKKKKKVKSIFTERTINKLVN